MRSPTTSVHVPGAPPLDPLGVVLARYLLTGDESAVEEVVAATRPRLLGAARRIVRGEDAEDAVQTAYLSLVRRCASVRRAGAPLGAPVLPWLLTAVVRTAYRRRALERRDRALADRLGMVPDEAAPAAAPEDLARLRDAVHRLPGRYRDVVVLHGLHGLSTAETARLLDLTEAGVRTRMHRARLLVRARLLPRAVASVLWLPALALERFRDGGLVAAVAAGGVMNVPALVVTAAVALAAGVLAGRSVLAPTAAPLEAELARVEGRVGELERAVAETTKERDALKVELAAAKAGALAASPTPPRPAPAPTPAPATPPPADGPARPDASPKVAAAPVRVEGFEEVVDGIDWAAAGRSASGLAPLLPPFFEEWAKSGKIPSQSVGRIQLLNAGLVEAAITAAGRLKVDVMSANSAYTHPSFLVNLVASALAAAGQPLTPAQLEAVTALGKQHAAEEARRAAGYREDAWELQKLLDETALKRRFMDAVLGTLTDEQRRAIVPDAARDRMQADLFSAALIWARYAQVLPVDSREELVTKLEGSVCDLLGWGAEKRPLVHDAVAAAVASMPPAYLDEPADELCFVGMVPLARVVDAAERQLALLQRVAEAQRFDEKMMAAVRQVTLVAVPLRKKPR